MSEAQNRRSTDDFYEQPEDSKKTELLARAKLRGVQVAGNLYVAYQHKFDAGESMRKPIVSGTINDVLADASLSKYLAGIRGFKKIIEVLVDNSPSATGTSLDEAALARTLSENDTLNLDEYAIAFYVSVYTEMQRLIDGMFGSPQRIADEISAAAEGATAMDVAAE